MSPWAARGPGPKEEMRQGSTPREAGDGRGADGGEVVALEGKEGQSRGSSRGKSSSDDLGSERGLTAAGRVKWLEAPTGSCSQLALHSQGTFQSPAWTPGQRDETGLRKAVRLLVCLRSPKPS